MTAKAPQLAVDTCARRLGSIGGPGARPQLTWFGPARLAPAEPGTEAVVQARCGLLQVHGRDGGRPRRLGLDVASVAAGILAAQGQLAAAVAGLRGGTVPVAHTSVLQAGLLLLSHYFVVATGLGDAVPGPPLPEPGPPFRSADGVWFEIETLDPEPWKSFWTSLGAGGADLGRAWTVFRWRYERAACSSPPGLHQATRSHDLAALRRVAEEAGVSLTPLRGYPDAVDEPGLDAAHPTLRSRENGYRRPPGRSGPADLPLTGIRVVEATSRIQGPFAGMCLRMLGADVVRVQPPQGDYGRAALCLHRGKAAVQLDLDRPAGRAALIDLVAGADVFLHNWRPGKADEWGLAFDDLAPRRPGLVYANTSGWGDRPQAATLVGTDFLVQAYTGLGHGLHPEPEPPFPSRVILCDLFGALVAAEGVLTGLYRRELTGHAFEVRSSLVAGAMALQANVLDDLLRDKEVGRAGGRPVWSTFDRPVPTADGDLMVGVDDDETFARLCRAFGLDPAAGSRDPVERRIAVRLGEGTTATGEEQLRNAGVPVARVCEDLADVASHPATAAMFEPVGGTALAPRSPWTFR